MPHLQSSANILPDKAGIPVKAKKPSNLGDMGENLGFFLGGAGSEAKRLFQTDL